jgi:hypothetical protein
MSSGKGRRVPTEGSAEEAADLRASQQLEFALQGVELVAMSAEAVGIGH